MRVLVVEDHPLFRQSLKTLLTGLESDTEVVEAGSVEEAVAIGGGAAIDLILLDLGLPGCRGLEALEAAKRAFAGVPIVIVSGDENPRVMRAAVEAGAEGYIPKTSDASLTVGALRVVLAHGVYLPAHLLLTLPTLDVKADASGAAASSAPGFSPRQWEVLRWLLECKPNKVIARELGIAEGTVKAHVASICQTLGVTGRTMAIIRAQELGLAQHPRLNASPRGSIG